MPAKRLWAYMKTHAFPDIHCFHDLPARIFTAKGNGPNSGLTYMACHFSSNRQSCSFWISVDQIAANDVGRLLTEHPRRPEYELIPKDDPLDLATASAPPQIQVPSRASEEVEEAFQQALTLSLKDYIGGTSTSAPPNLERRVAQVKLGSRAKKAAEGPNFHIVRLRRG